ncbi:MAG: 50S ribosomal protein L18 [Patescibacteria group bacterium]|nr:50S ribosomal protein L18 [Patescibacteria group bacterium]
MNKKLLRIRRHKRIRSRMEGFSTKPRLVVFRSNKHIYAQLIDDSASKTLVAATDTELKDLKLKKGEIALEVGKLIAKKASEKKITEVVFDRGGYKYAGRVKSLADGARKGGLKF